MASFPFEPAADPEAPPPPTHGPLTGGGTVVGDMDAVHIASLTGATINEATATTLGLQGPAVTLGLIGRGFTFDANEQLTGGAIDRLSFGVQLASGGLFQASLSVPGVSAAPFGGWVAADATQAAFVTLLAGSEQLVGQTQGDLIRGFGGDDVIFGGGGSDSLFGGDGEDQVFAADTSDYDVGQRTTAPTFLRGEAGDDYIVGNAGFDDILGNMGNDTERGGDGDDWVVGGKDNDLLFGEAGGDIVYGNLGSDTCVGGEGADLIRGGQADDQLYGGAGDDWLSGDRGADTVSGGAGADIFHSFADAGLDRVLDFNAAEGDRVQLDPGTPYSAAQSGADTVIDMGGGNQMVLVGVTLSSLPAGWIFGA